MGLLDPRRAANAPRDYGPGDETSAPVEVSLDVHDIYSSSTVWLRARSTGEFSLQLAHGRIFEIATGVRLGTDRAKSAGAGTAHTMDIRITGIFGQRPIEPGDDIRLGGAPGLTRAEYGVRFFPFISSILDLGFRVPGATIRSVVVLVRPEIRLLWDLAKLSTDPASSTIEAPPGVIAHSPGGWQQALVFDEDEPMAVSLAMPAVASGRLMTRAVMYPLVVWFGSLVATFAASELLNTSAVVAAVGASWTLGLREWLLSERAHQITLGQALLVLQGLAISLWAAALVWLPTWACISVIALFAVAGAALVRTAATFEYRAVLPIVMAQAWGRCATALEARRAARRRKLGLRGFDHESTSSGQP